MPAKRTKRPRKMQMLKHETATILQEERQIREGCVSYKPAMAMKRSVTEKDSRLNHEKTSLRDMEK